MCLEVVKLASKYNDKSMKEFGKMIMTIDPEIRDYLAEKFIRDAHHRHAIAFFQWRLYFDKTKNLQYKWPNADLKSYIDNRVDRLNFKEFLASDRLKQYQEDQQNIYKRQQ